MFSSPAPFDEVFPEIAEITVDVKEDGYMLHERQKRSYHMTKEDINPEFSCHNVSCKKNSGFNIQSVIRNMVRNRETDKEGGVRCKGWETSMKRNCMNHIEVKIQIKYKETPVE